MAMVAATLQAGLMDMANVDNELEAIDNFVSAWSDFAYESDIGGVPATPGTMDAALATMKGAMTGMNTAGSTAIQAGIQAFWTAVIPLAVTVWPQAPPNVLTVLAPLPLLSGIAASLDGVFAANTAGELDKNAATTAIAGAIHPLQLGGIATITPPPPAPPFPLPLL